MIVSNKLITIMFSGRNKLISANRLEDNLFSCIPNIDLAKTIWVGNRETKFRSVQLYLKCSEKSHRRCLCCHKINLFIDFSFQVSWELCLLKISKSRYSVLTNSRRASGGYLKLGQNFRSLCRSIMFNHCSVANLSEGWMQTLLYFNFQ